MSLALVFTDIFILAMINPELEDTNNLNKIFASFTVSSRMFLIVAVIVTQGTIGVDLARHTVFPFYKFTRAIDILEIFERIDATFVFMWILTSIARISGFTYIAIRAFREIFGKKEDEKVILYIVGSIILIVSLTLIQRRPVIGIRKEIDLFLNVLNIIFMIFFPLLTCIVFFFRKSSIEEKLKER